MSTDNYITNSTITYSSGVVLGAKSDSRPAPTPKEIIATRAIETKDGWRGQIVMSSEIVLETDPFEESQEALSEVHALIHEAFKRLIVGA